MTINNTSIGNGWIGVVSIIDLRFSCGYCRRFSVGRNYGRGGWERIWGSHHAFGRLERVSAGPVLV